VGAEKAVTVVAEAEQVDPLVEEIMLDDDFLWRLEQFRALQFTTAQATTLAFRGADWHTAVELVKAGCPTDTAFDILS